MKKAVILHGTDASPRDNWFPWLHKELEKLGWQVWTPDLPHAQKPDPRNYTPYILENMPWEPDSDTVFIGHSSGAVAILNFLNALIGEIKVGDCYLVSAFKDSLGWDALLKLFPEQFDFPRIKKQAKSFTLIHSDDDPHVPLEHAEYLAEELGAELIVIKAQQHFSTGTAGPKYKKFPKLLELITR